MWMPKCLAYSLQPKLQVIGMHHNQLTLKQTLNYQFFKQYYVGLRSSKTIPIIWPAVCVQSRHRLQLVQEQLWKQIDSIIAKSSWHIPIPVSNVLLLRDVFVTITNAFGSRQNWFVQPVRKYWLTLLTQRNIYQKTYQRPHSAFSLVILKRIVVAVLGRFLLTICLTSVRNNILNVYKCNSFSTKLNECTTMQVLLYVFHVYTFKV